MKLKQWMLGLVIGLTAGLLVGGYYAYTDWQLNPGGIFHNEQGTDWGIVIDTVTSWWLPIAAWGTGITWVVLFVVGKLRKWL